MILLSFLLTSAVARISYYATLVLTTGIIIAALGSTPAEAASHRPAPKESHQSVKKPQPPKKKQVEVHSSPKLKPVPKPKPHLTKLRLKPVVKGQKTVVTGVRYPSSTKPSATPKPHKHHKRHAATGGISTATPRIPTTGGVQSHYYVPAPFVIATVDVDTIVIPNSPTAAKKWAETLTQHIRPTLQNGEPLLPEVQSYFASSLPKAIKSLSIENQPSNDIDIRPVIASSAILFLTISTVAGLFYVSNRNGIMTIGRFNFSRLVKNHDLTQIAAFVIVAVGFSFVTVYLVFSGI